MEQKKWKWVFGVVGVISLGLLVWWSQIPQTYTDLQAKTKLQEIQQKASESKQPKQITALVAGEVSRLPEPYRATAIDTAIRSVYQQIGEMREKGQGFQPALRQIEREQGTLHNVEHWKTNDATISSYFTELRLRSLQLRKQRGEYIPVPDLQYAYDQLHAYMKPDQAFLTKFAIRETKTSFYDEAKRKFNISELHTRLLLLQEAASNWPKSIYTVTVKQNMEYYADFYFGFSHSEFNTLSGTFSQKIVKQYEGLETKYPNARLSQWSKTYRQLLAKNRWKLNPDIKKAIRRYYEVVETAADRKKREEELRRALENQLKQGQIKLPPSKETTTPKP